MPISYFNPKQEIRLSAYADTIVLEPDGREQRLRAIRFGGYPEMVRAMSDAIYAGATLETNSRRAFTRICIGRCCIRAVPVMVRSPGVALR